MDRNEGIDTIRVLSVETEALQPWTRFKLAVYTIRTHLDMINVSKSRSATTITAKTVIGSHVDIADRRSSRRIGKVETRHLVVASVR